MKLLVVLPLALSLFSGSIYAKDKDYSNLLDMGELRRAQSMVSTAVNLKKTYILNAEVYATNLYEAAKFSGYPMTEAEIYTEVRRFVDAAKVKYVTTEFGVSNQYESYDKAGDFFLNLPPTGKYSGVATALGASLKYGSYLAHEYGLGYGVIMSKARNYRAQRESLAFKNYYLWHRRFLDNSKGKDKTLFNVVTRLQNEELFTSYAENTETMKTKNPTVWSRMSLEEMIQKNKDQAEIQYGLLSDINDDVTENHETLKNYIAGEKASRDKAMWNEVRIEAYRSGVYVGAVVLEAMGADPKSVNQFSVVGGAAIKVFESLERYDFLIKAAGGDSGKEGLATAAMTGNLVQAAMMLVQAFGSSSKSADEIILGQLQAIREDIQTLRKEMHERFTDLNETLARNQSSNEHYFERILLEGRMTLEGVREIQAKLQEDRDRQEYMANNDRDKLINVKNADFNLEFKNCIENKRLRPDIMTSTNEADKCSSFFFELASTGSGLEPFVATRSTGFTAENLIGLSDPYYNFDYINSVIQGSGSGKFSHPYAWANAALSLIEVIKLNPTLDVTIAKARLSDTKVTGENIQTNVARIARDAKGKVRSDIFQKLLKAYEGSLANVIARVREAVSKNADVPDKSAAMAMTPDEYFSGVWQNPKWMSERYDKNSELQIMESTKIKFCNAPNVPQYSGLASKWIWKMIPKEYMLYLASLKDTDNAFKKEVPVDPSSLIQFCYQFDVDVLDAWAGKAGKQNVWYGLMNLNVTIVGSKVVQDLEAKGKSKTKNLEIFRVRKLYGKLVSYYFPIDLGKGKNNEAQTRSLLGRYKKFPGARIFSLDTKGKSDLDGMLKKIRPISFEKSNLKNIPIIPNLEPKAIQNYSFLESMAKDGEATYTLPTEDKKAVSASLRAYYAGKTKEVLGKAAESARVGNLKTALDDLDMKVWEYQTAMGILFSQSLTTNVELQESVWGTARLWNSEQLGKRAFRVRWKTSYPDGLLRLLSHSQMNPKLDFIVSARKQAKLLDSKVVKNGGAESIEDVTQGLSAIDNALFVLDHPELKKGKKKKKKKAA